MNSTITILYEDDAILIVNKPNNVLVHNSYYARNIKSSTLIQLIKKQLGLTVYPVHRLDRKTSGVLLLTKDKKFVPTFQKLFFEDTINKDYLGIVRGHINHNGQIDSPVKNPDTKIYKDALTLFTPLKQVTFDIPVHPYPTSRYSLIRLSPKTGRMHQLRIHLNKISHPLVGDYKYGDRFHNRMFEQHFNSSILFLHAEKLTFPHPLSNVLLTVKAPLPCTWNTIKPFFLCE